MVAQFKMAHMKDKTVFLAENLWYAGLSMEIGLWKTIFNSLSLENRTISPAGLSSATMNVFLQDMAGWLQGLVDGRDVDLCTLKVLLVLLVWTRKACLSTWVVDSAGLPMVRKIRNFLKDGGQLLKTGISGTLGTRTGTSTVGVPDLQDPGFRLRDHTTYSVL